MRHINKNVEGVIPFRECILVQAGLVRRAHFQDGTGSQRSLVVTNLGHVGSSSSIVHGITQGVLHPTHDRHLGDNAVLWSTTGSALMQHREACKVADRLISRIGISPTVQIWAQLDNTQGTGNTRKGVSIVD